ncbi:hypothetical protein ELV29_24730 [Escherichia coli]|nr:hypothetical protein ELV29_24730 [Escherichia coli]
MVNGKFSFIPSTPTRFRAWHDYYKPGRPGLFIIYGAYYGKRKLTAVCSHQTRIGNLDAHLI